MRCGDENFVHRSLACESGLAGGAPSDGCCGVLFLRRSWSSSTGLGPLRRIGRSSWVLTAIRPVLRWRVMPSGGAALRCGGGDAAPSTSVPNGRNTAPRNRDESVAGTPARLRRRDARNERPRLVSRRGSAQPRDEVLGTSSPDRLTQPGSPQQKSKVDRFLRIFPPGERRGRLVRLAAGCARPRRRPQWPGITPSDCTLAWTDGAVVLATCSHPPWRKPGWSCASPAPTLGLRLHPS